MYVNDYRNRFPRVCHVFNPSGNGGSNSAGWIYWKNFRFYDNPTSIVFENSLIFPYVGDEAVFVCPCESSNAQVSYSANTDASWSKITEAKKPSDTPLILEEGCNNQADFTDDGAFYVENYANANYVKDAHNGRSVYGYIDNHVESLFMPHISYCKKCDYRAPFVSWQ